MEKQKTEEKLEAKDFLQKGEKLILTVVTKTLEYNGVNINGVELMCLKELGKMIENIKNLLSLLEGSQDVPFLFIKYSSDILEAEEKINNLLSMLETAKENPEKVVFNKIGVGIRNEIFYNLKNRH